MAISVVYSNFSGNTRRSFRYGDIFIIYSECSVYCSLFDAEWWTGWAKGKLFLRRLSLRIKCAPGRSSENGVDSWKVCFIVFLVDDAFSGDIKVDTSNFVSFMGDSIHISFLINLSQFNAFRIIIFFIFC